MYMEVIWEGMNERDEDMVKIKEGTCMRGIKAKMKK